MSAFKLVARSSGLQSATCLAWPWCMHGLLIWYPQVVMKVHQLFIIKVAVESRHQGRNKRDHMCPCHASWLVFSLLFDLGLTQCSGETWCSSTVKANLNPRWTANDWHEFVIYDMDQRIRIEVFDEDICSRAHLRQQQNKAGHVACQGTPRSHRLPQP